MFFRKAKMINILHLYIMSRHDIALGIYDEYLKRLFLYADQYKYKNLLELWDTDFSKFPSFHHSIFVLKANAWLQTGHSCPVLHNIFQRKSFFFLLPLSAPSDGSDFRRKNNIFPHMGFVQSSHIEIKKKSNIQSKISWLTLVYFFTVLRTRRKCLHPSSGNVLLDWCHTYYRKNSWNIEIWRYSWPVNIVTYSLSSYFIFHIPLGLANCTQFPPLCFRTPLNIARRSELIIAHFVVFTQMTPTKYHIIKQENRPYQV